MSNDNFLSYAISLNPIISTTITKFFLRYRPISALFQKFRCLVEGWKNLAQEYMN